MTTDAGGKVKRYKPQRVMDPREGISSCRLYPCQGLRVILSDISKWAPAYPKLDYEVKVHSPYLIITGESRSDRNGGETWYDIEQKYDLTAWAEHGNIHLGHISIRAWDQNGLEVSDSTIVVRLAAADPDNRGLTVVNPAGGVVQMYADEYLEVIAFESDWNIYKPGEIEAPGLGDDWDAPKAAESSKSGLTLKQCSKLVVHPDRPVTGSALSFPGVPLYPTAANPRLPALERVAAEAGLKGIRLPLRQHHFWYLLDNVSKKRTHGLKQEDYSLGTMKFYGRVVPVTEAGCLTTVRDFKLHMQVRAAKKRVDLPVVAATGQNDYISGTLRDTHYNDKRMVLINPPAGRPQVCEFAVGHRTLTVEITQPSVFFETVPDVVRWVPTLSESGGRHGAVFVEPAADRVIGEKTIQTYKIRCGDHVSHAEDHPLYLGRIVFFVPGFEQPDSKRTITLWMRNRKHGTTPVTIPPLRNARNTPERWEVSVVTFTELERSDDLAAHATSRSSIDIFAPAGGGCGGKKKGNNNNTGSGACSPYRPPIALPQSPTWDGGGKVVAKATARAGAASGGTNRGEMGTVVFIQNPSHLSCHTIRHGQVLSIRMSPPFELVGERAKREQWAVRITEGAPALRLMGNRLMVIAGATFNSFDFEVDYGGVENGGTTKLLGVVDFLCGSQTRRVRLFCTPAPVAVPAADTEYDFSLAITLDKMNQREKAMRMLPRPKGAASQPYVYVQDYEHNDAVAVEAGQNLYVEVPVILGWDQSRWTAVFTQKPLPYHVWNAVSPADRREIDRLHPWSPNDDLSGFFGCFSIPSPGSAPAAAAIIQAVKQTSADRVLIGEIAFENNNPETDGLTVGIVRKLGVFLNLVSAERVDDVVQVTNFIDGERVSVTRGDTVEVRMTADPDEDGRVSTLWYPVGLPFGFEFESSKRMPNGTECQTRFRIGEAAVAGNHNVRYACGKSNRTLVVVVPEAGVAAATG